MSLRSSLRRCSFLLGLTFLLAGCARSPVVRFYTLAPLASQEAQRLSKDRAQRVSIRILPVRIPDYLDRPQIVTGDGGNGLKLAEFNRWAGSLRDNMSTVLAENLGLLLGSDRVFVHPLMAGEKAEYSVAVQIVRLDSMPGEQATLKARWALSSDQMKEEAKIHAASFTQSLSDNSYDTLVTAISHLLGVLSKEIATEIANR